MNHVTAIRLRTYYNGSPCGAPDYAGLDYAVRELRHFLQEYTTVKLVRDTAWSGNESTIRGSGESASRSAIESQPKHAGAASVELCLDTSRKPHCYALKGDGTTLRITGGSASSVLCGVYEALGIAGVCFEAVGYSLPGPFDMGAFLSGNKEVSPKCRLRGIRQHINFPMDISSYSLKEAKEYIRSIARMRFNAITFHSYGGQWHSVVPGDPNKQAGHFFYGQYHPVPVGDPLTASRINNRRTYCIPEAEAFYEDSSARDEYAKYWLNEVMNAAKEAYMTITLSVELPFEDEERLGIMLHEVCRTYPQIDVLELISYESGGGGRIENLTRENVSEILAGMFGRQILNPDGELEGLGEELPKQLGGAAVSLKRMLTAIAAKERWLDGLTRVPKLRAGLYITCQETLKVLWPIMRDLLPADVSKSLLPAHGSLAVANGIAAIGTNDFDWQNTMYYSWAEFDGNMYIQQLSTDGLEKLAYMADAESIYGFCINHWRTAENRITIAYASETAITPVTTGEFYRNYASRLGITAAERFAAVCDRLAALDAYCRDNLFNIGFCYVNCWFRKGSVVRPRDYSFEAQSHAIGEYEAITCEYEELLNSAATKEAIALIRLMMNRCTTSALHIKAMLTLQDIHKYYDYDNPSELTKEQADAIHAILAQSRKYAQDYIRLYGEMLPDRGCEGNIVSYSVTAPVFIDAVASNFVNSIKVEQTEHFDAPPAPDTESK